MLSTSSVDVVAEVELGKFTLTETGRILQTGQMKKFAELELGSFPSPSPLV